VNNLFLLIILLLSSIENITFAQEYNSKGYYIGPNLDYNIGSIDLSQNRAVRGASLANFNSLSGGLIFSYKINKLSLQTELIFNSRSSNDSEFESLDTSPFTSNLKASFSYLNIPLLVGYDFSNKALTPYGILGLHFGLSTKSELTIEFDDDLPSFIPQMQPITRWDRTEYGVVLELGVKKYMINKSYIGVGLRYTGTERTYRINNGLISGGAANLGINMMSGSISYMFSI